MVYVLSLDLPSTALERILSSLAGYVSCEQCKSSIEEQVARIIIEWESVKVRVFVLAECTFEHIFVGHDLIALSLTTRPHICTHSTTLILVSYYYPLLYFLLIDLSMYVSYIRLPMIMNEYLIFAARNLIGGAT